MKRTVSKDYRDGYILGIDTVIENGFQLSLDDKKKLMQAFDKMYDVASNPGNARSTSDFKSINE